MQIRDDNKSYNARNSLDTFPRNFSIDGEVANLLAKRQTLLTCQDIANKSATSWQRVVVIEFGKRQDTTDAMDFCPPYLVTDL